MIQNVSQKIEYVKSLIKEKFDQYIIDQNTGYYNEMFLKELMTSDFVSYASMPQRIDGFFLLYFSIDNFSEINAQYSTEIGDETIRNLGYLLNQSKREDNILIKRNGPGFILYVPYEEGFSVSGYAHSLQIEIKRSKAFVEQISVSIAEISSFEVDKELPADELVNTIISRGNKRINIVPTMGPNAYLDTDLVKKNHTFGRVLIVSSDPLAVRMFQTFFTESGMEVLVAHDPYLALDIAYQETVDAIICEKTMPKMDGYTFKSKLNDNTFTMNTLFILLSYQKTVDIIRRANELRIDYVISRPIIYDQILGFIHREMKKKGTRL